MAWTEVTAQLNKELKDYTSEVKEKVVACQKKAANYTARKLRNTSPRKTGNYASGWTSKTEVDELTATSTVYNRKAPHLTHLLENGHVTRNKKGYFGRTPAHVHIKPAEEDGARYFEQLLREEIGE